MQAALPFQGKDMGPDPLDRAGPDHISAEGCATAYKEAAEEEGGGELGISSADGSNGGSELQRDRGLSNEEAEYGRGIYCNTTDSVTL